jgi:hypothetical protein
MKIAYEDEYQTQVFYTDDSSTLPPIGASVVIREDIWRVDTVTIYPEHDSAIVSITQKSQRSAATPAKPDNRLAEANRAIVELSKKHDDLKKSTRLVREQVSSIRTHINTQIRKERKPE